MNDEIKNVSYIFPKGSLEDDWREEALRHREEILQLKSQLQQKENIIKGLDNTIENLEEVVEHKENIIKEVREYINNHLYMESTGGIQHPTFDGKMNRDTNGFEILEILDKEVN